MPNVQFGASLAESLKILRVTLQALRVQLSLPSVPAESRFPNLLAVVDSLDHARPLKSISSAPECAGQWHEVLIGKRRNLEPRAIRSLCWEPAVATSQAFQSFLNRTKYVPNAQALQGMINCCHARWSRELAVGEAVGHVRNRLQEYSGRNRLLNKWKDSASMIIGSKAHDVMAAELLKCADGLPGFCRFWGLAIESSQLFHSAAEVASVLCLDQIDRVPQYREFLFKELITWQGWAPSMLKNVVSRLILSPRREAVDLIETITIFVKTDRRFGDPRHPHNHNNWIGMDEASSRVQEWLSAADITFFFETVLPRGTDPHGRKEFWLRYVGCRGLRSRPLLSSSDKFRLRDVLSKKGTATTNFGRLLDEDTSAFILDFGPMMVIEFSSVGNACYVYEKQSAAEVVPDIWTSLPFSKTKLKLKSKIATLHPVRHDSQNRWKGEMERTLARYGVRAVS